MNLIEFAKNNFHENPIDEISGSFRLKKHESMYKGSSIKGRVVCLGLTGIHAAAIFIKPYIYLSLTIGHLSVGIFSGLLFVFSLGRLQGAGGVAATSLLEGLSFSLTAVVSPIGQIAETVKACAGIIHPGAYFKEKTAPQATATQATATQATAPQATAPRAITQKKRKPITSAYPFGTPIVSMRNRTPLILRQEHIYINSETDAPEQNPPQALHSLAEKIKYERGNTLQVKFTGSPAIDVGGLRRDLVQRIAKEVSKEYNLQDGVILWSEDNNQLLKDLGALFGFLLQDLSRDSICDTPIGEVFHREYFSGILSFSEDLAEKPFDLFLVEEILPILKEIATDEVEKKHYDDIQTFIDWDGSIEGDEKSVTFLKNYEAITLHEFPENTFTDKEKTIFNKEMLFKTQLIIIDDFMESDANKVKALHTIASEMHRIGVSWPHLKSIGVKQVRKHIEGEFDKTKMKRLLAFHLPPGWDEEIRKWVDKKSDDELRQFLATVTGSRALSNKQILFRSESCDGFTIHTCGPYIDIPRQVINWVEEKNADGTLLKNYLGEPQGVENKIKQTIENVLIELDSYCKNSGCGNSFNLA